MPEVVDTREAPLDPGHLTLSPRRLAGDSALYATAGAIGKAIALLSVPIFTRSLGADGYGLTDLATSFAAALVLIGRFGGEVPVARLASAAVTRSERHVVLGTFLLLTALVSTALSLALIPAIPLIANLWASPDEVGLAGLSLILGPISAIQVALVSVVRLQERSITVAALAVVDLIAQVVFALALVLLGFGPVGAVIGYIIGSAIGAVAAAAVAHRHVSLAIHLPLARQMLLEGVQYLPAFVAFTLSDQIVRFLTADRLGPDVVGSLAVAIRVSSVIALAVSAFQFAWAPIALSMSRSHQTGRILEGAFRWYIVVSSLASIAVGAWAPEIVLIVAGDEFSQAAAPTAGLAWSLALGGAFFMLMTVAGITRRGPIVMAAAVGGAAAQVTIAFLAVDNLGLPAISGAAVAGRLAALLLLGRGVRDFVSIWSWRNTFWIIGGTVATAVLTVLAADPASRGLRITVGVAASAALLYIGPTRLRRRGEIPPHEDAGGDAT